ncbi:MAG: hypothetical protein GWP91_15845 [Rhodobacterales bacterium]|nr:hypothetical protein [Rhodobacterales bacterium]
MGEMITKPDTNPILIAVLNLFLFNCVGYFMMGQQKKAIVSVVMTFVMMFVAACTMGMASPLVPIWGLIVTYDAYLVAQKLASGESVGMNENGLDFLNAIFKD